MFSKLRLRLSNEYTDLKQQVFMNIRNKKYYGADSKTRERSTQKGEKGISIYKLNPMTVAECKGSMRTATRGGRRVTRNRRRFEKLHESFDQEKILLSGTMRTPM